MAADTSLVTFSVADGVGHITVNRPEAANAFDLPTAREFAAAVVKADGDDSVRVVLVSGAGKRFCAGGDVASFVDAPEPSDYLLVLATELDAAFRHLASLAKPVVSVVQGAVAGAGLGLMLAADVVISEPGTKFVFAYPGIGATPDCGVSYLLPRAVGQQRALQFALLGKPLSAEQALDWGLVAEVDEAAAERAAQVAATFAAGPALALGQARRLIRGSADRTREEIGADEARTIAASVSTEESQALIKAFLKR
ncbi:MAG: enoyl-CoA hydratase/isomerase family protein [Nocardioides sp.]|uniref:enoyl-CoA hydratase/isomerase family protein n=1 Tax=Nocardioides sp. TaxID=35761 RepID=UPI003F0FE7FC